MQANCRRNKTCHFVWQRSGGILAVSMGGLIRSCRGTRRRNCRRLKRRRGPGGGGQERGKQLLPDLPPELSAACAVAGRAGGGGRSWDEG